MAWASKQILGRLFFFGDAVESKWSFGFWEAMVGSCRTARDPPSSEPDPHEVP